MPPRIQPDQIDRPRRQVNATTAGAYVAPNARRANAGRLASALSGVSRQLESLGLQLQTERDNRAHKDGQAFAEQLARDGVTFRQAIAQGKITADQSPFFRLGAEEQLGRLTADRFDAELRNRLTTDPKLRESTNPDDFDAFIQTFQAEFDEENVGGSASRYFNQGYAPRASAHISNARNAFASRAGALLIEETKENTYQEIVNGIEQDLLAGRPIEESIKVTAARQYAIGLTGQELNRQIAQAVIDVAVERTKPELLEALDNIPTGSGRVGDISYVKDAADNARQRIYADMRRERAEARADRQEAERLFTKQVREDMVNAYLEGDPGALFAAIERDPDNAHTLNALYSSLQDARFGHVNYAFANRFQVDIDRTLDPTDPAFVTVDDLHGSLLANQIDLPTYQNFKRQIEARDQRIESASENLSTSAFRHPLYIEAVQNIENGFSKTAWGTFEDPEMAEQARFSVGYFTNAWLAEMAKPDGVAQDPRELTKWVFDMTTEALQFRSIMGNDPTRPSERRADAGFIATIPDVTRQEAEELTIAYNDAFESGEDSLADAPRSVIRIMARFNLRTLEDLRNFIVNQIVLLNGGQDPAAAPADTTNTGN